MGSCGATTRTGTGYDAVLFGQVDPTVIDLDELQARLDRPDHARGEAVAGRCGLSHGGGFAGHLRGAGGGFGGLDAGRADQLRQQPAAAIFGGDVVEQLPGTELLAGITRYCKFPDSMFVGSDELKKALEEQLKFRKRN